MGGFNWGRLFPPKAQQRELREAAKEFIPDDYWELVEAALAVVKNPGNIGGIARLAKTLKALGLM